MSKQTRPRQTTFAGGMIIIGSIFVLLAVWEAASGLRGIESREGIEKFLSEPPGDQFGLSVEEALQALRATAAVAGFCAAMSLVLGIYALQGHRAARLGLSVLAVPLFLTGLVAGGFMSAIVAVAIALLWLSPSREWFAGEPVPDGTTGASGSSDAPRPPVWPPPLPPTHDAGHSDAQADQPALSSSGSTAVTERPTEQHGGWPPSPALPPAPAPSRRPEGVTLAFIMTLVSAGLVLLLTGLSVLVMAVSPGTVMDEMLRQQPELTEQGVTERMVRITTFVMGGLTMLWCVVAIVLAFLTLRRNRTAARGLMVCAAVSAVLCIAGTFASLVLALPAFASIITVATLRRPEVRAWLAGDSR